MAATNICKYCETANAPNAKFCARCGQDLNTGIVDNFARIQNARWQQEIIPASVTQPPPAENIVRAVGESWEQNGLALRLTELEIRSESDWHDAAFYARYELINTTDQSPLVEIDYGHLSIVDSLGGRFSDWDGGGLHIQWLGPGESLQFNRYYSEMSGISSRITRGAEFALVQFENTGGIAKGIWQLDITR